jgi:hypothetical protein
MFYNVQYHGTYEHSIWADTEYEAKDICARFGFYWFGTPDIRPNEMRPSVIAKRRGLGPALLHSITFLSFLACRCGAATGEELLHDDAALHTLVHLQHFGMLGIKNPARIRLARGIRRLESIVPGLPPAWVKDLPIIKVQALRLRSFDIDKFGG